MSFHFVKKLVPAGVKDKIKEVKREYLWEQARKAIEKAADEPGWLSLEQLKTLVNQYSYDRHYNYEENSLLNRGEQRAEELKRLVPEFDNAVDFLELGCYDGLVCTCLNQIAGKNAIGIDWRTEGFHAKALGNKPFLMQMDAHNLSFPAESFHVVFSYDAFEHFAWPDKVLSEAYRVLRKGGYIYLDIGPLYPSPYGLHIYHLIPVPYCQFLFSGETMTKFGKENNTPEIYFDYVNNWSVVQFRKLWKDFSDKLQIVAIHEIKVDTGMELIRAYPSCFKGKYDAFESLVTPQIRILLKKIG